MNLHAKYQRSGPYGFRQEDFNRFALHKAMYTYFAGKNSKRVLLCNVLPAISFIFIPKPLELAQDSSLTPFTFIEALQGKIQTTVMRIISYKNCKCRKYCAS